MRRFFGLAALVAAGLGVWLLFAGSDVALPPKGALLLQDAQYASWAVGLLMGLTLAWLAMIDWRDWPARSKVWLKLQRRRLGLVALGGVFAGILLLF